MDIDINEAIRESAMLVSYHTAGWSARIPDPDAAQAAAAQLGITTSSLSSQRNLMDGADARLKAVLSAQKAGRNAHTLLTLPWSTGGTRGPRMLPTSSWQAYMQVVAKAKGVFDKALKEFLDNYDADADVAQARIQMVGDPLKLYPDKVTLEAMFSIRINFTPIPAGAEFKGLPDAVKTRLAESYESRMKSRFDAAMAEAFDRTRTALVNLVERLDSEDPTFKSAAVENVRDLGPLLRGWNLTRDAGIDAIANAIDKLLNGEDMTSLKANADVRRLVVREARELLKDLEGLAHGR